MSASYIDLYIETDNEGRVKTKLYHKCDYRKYTSNFPYGVGMSLDVIVSPKKKDTINI